MRVIYGYAFCASYDYADAGQQDKWSVVARLPVWCDGDKVGMAYPRWAEGGYHILLDFVFDEIPDERILNLYPHKWIDVRKVGKLVTKIELVEQDPGSGKYESSHFFSYQTRSESLIDHVNANYPLCGCTCGSAYTSLPTFHYDWCSIKRGPPL